MENFNGPSAQAERVGALGKLSFGFFGEESRHEVFVNGLARFCLAYDLAFTGGRGR
jgi:hypothetical protein